LRSPSLGMTILVTGGAGFIGSHLIQRLLADDSADRIVCLDDFNDYYDPALKRENVALFADDRRVKIVEGTVCDSAAMSRLLTEHDVRQVVHLAAYAGVRASLDRPAIFETVNVGGTLALLEAVHRRPVDRFVFVSSSTVYGDTAEVPFAEDATLGIPLSPYGVTKRAAELMALAYWRLHGVPVVCLRPFSVYGSRIRPDLAMWIFARAIREGRPLPLLGDGSQLRDFTHVSDVCAGIVAAVTAESVAGEAINLGHHEPAEIRRLVSLLEAELGRRANIEYRAANAADLPVTCADLTKATRLLGYRPQMSLADGVREFAAWFNSRVLSP
jgi:UDP-glucuronate 4-epimerase